MLIDEEGNEFSVVGFEMFRFTGNIPEWNSRFVTISIIGENYCIGNYLRRKGADSNDRRDDMIAPFMEQIGEDAEPSEVYMKWMEVAEEILSKNRK